MEFLIKNGVGIKQKTDCLILSIFDDKKLSDELKILDDLTHNQISTLIKQGDINGKLGSVLTFHNLDSISAKKLMIVGAGKKTQFNEDNANKIISAVINESLKYQIKDIVCSLLDLNSSLAYSIARQFVEVTEKSIYRFDEYQTQKQPAISLKKVTLLLSDKKANQLAQQGVTHGIAIANAVKATKTLANQPSNICNAQYLADKGLELSQIHSLIKTTCYKEKELAKLNMNAYLAVGRGSANESIMTVMEYSGAKNKKEAPIVLVGKGLTFDSGGISIKPAGGMDEMKYDMCGAATVYGVMKAVCELNLPINIVGVMAGCENMPGGQAYRPGDILTTMSGQTVEVINTDAEGRLVLCDALTFVERFNPKYVIDIATLTGACIVALGHHYTGVVGNDDKLIKSLLNASNAANDKAWQLPMDDDFQEQIKSTCADIVNSAGRDGGTITAGCFLSKFTQGYHWAHLDIAGTAWTSGAKKGATGRPVAMLVQFLIDQSR